MFATLVAVEGPDKVGKETQTKLLTQILKERGNKAVLVEVPYGDGVTYPLIYMMLKNGVAKRWPNLFQFVQFLNKFVFQFTALLWLLLTNDYVVLDRWSLSAIVYGDATGVNPTYNRFLYFLLKRPDVTVVLHGPSFRRKSEADDVYEADNDLQKAVKRGYYDWVIAHPADHELIDNQGTREDVSERVLAAVKST